MVFITVAITGTTTPIVARTYTPRPDPHQVLSIRRRADNGWTTARIARYHRLPQQTVARIIQRATYRDVDAFPTGECSCSWCRIDGRGDTNVGRARTMLVNVLCSECGAPVKVSVAKVLDADGAVDCGKAH